MTYRIDLDVVGLGDRYPSYWLNVCDYIRADSEYVRLHNGLYGAINQYLKSFNVNRVEHPGYHVVLEFESEADFLIFKLKWS